MRHKYVNILSSLCLVLYSLAHTSHHITSPKQYTQMQEWREKKVYLGIFKKSQWIQHKKGLLLYCNVLCVCFFFFRRSLITTIAAPRIDTLSGKYGIVSFMQCGCGLRKVYRFHSQLYTLSHEKCPTHTVERIRAGEKETDVRSRLALKYSFSQQTCFQLSFIVQSVNTCGAVASADRARCVFACVAREWPLFVFIVV